MIGIVITVAVIIIAATTLGMFILIVKELMDGMTEDEPMINSYRPHNDAEGNEEFDWGHNIRNQIQDEEL